MKTSLKIAAIGLFICGVVVFGWNGHTSAQSQDKSQGKQKVTIVDGASWLNSDQLRPAVSRGDCTYLNDRNIFVNAKAHARDLSNLTNNIMSQPVQNGGDIINPRQDTRIPRRNFVDDEIFGKMDRDGVKSAPLSSDEEFIRRVTLDLTGRIPNVDRIKQFLIDKSADKRDRLINELIGSSAFVDRWTMFYGDLLKNSAFSGNVIRYPQGRNVFYNMIRTAIANNTPYNQFVTSLITSSGNSFQVGGVNYIVGTLTPMGPPQDTYDAALVQSTTRFLGIETFDCLLCHDGQGHLNALNLWATGVKRKQAWGMSAFFARLGARANIVSQDPFIANFDIVDINNGQYMLNTDAGNRTPRQPVDGVNAISPEYLFNGEHPANGETYRAAFARIMTRDRQFARATVNYLWAHFFGLGIVDPPSGFDLARLDPNNPPPPPFELQPTHPALLERLADEFIANNYDLQHIMRVMAQSNAYQLSARYNGVWKEEYTTYFARKLVRRLDAEELHDAVTVATGTLPNYKVAGFSNSVQFAMQLPDTMEPFGAIYTGNNDYTESLARLFLNTLGRGDRDQMARSNQPSILQGLSQMNSPFVNMRIKVAGNTNATLSRLLKANPGDDQLVDELFLAVLSRRPTATEKAKALPVLQGDRTKGAEDLLWVMLNKIDFLYNY